MHVSSSLSVEFPKHQVVQHLFCRHHAYDEQLLLLLLQRQLLLSLRRFQNGSSTPILHTQSCLRFFPTITFTMKSSTTFDWVHSFCTSLVLEWNSKQHQSLDGCEQSLNIPSVYLLLIYTHSFLCVSPCLVSDDDNHFTCSYFFSLSLSFTPSTTLALIHTHYIPKSTNNPY